MLRLLAVFLLSPLVLFSSASGILQGTVTDAEVGDRLPGANITIIGQLTGTTTDANGDFKIENIAPGSYAVKTAMIGYTSKIDSNVVILADSTTILNIALSPIVIEGEEIIVEANRPGVYKDVTSSRQFVMSTSFRPQPSPTIHWQPNTEEYASIKENGFQTAFSTPISTFAADIDCASYSNIRRFLEDDRLPPPDAVRVEECINYFDYDYPQPEGETPLAIYTEYSQCPWQPEHQLVHIGLQGKMLSKAEQKPSNLVFLIDVSGSMSDRKKLPLVQHAFKLLVNQLGAQDRVAIVTYAGSAAVVLESTRGHKKDKIIDAIESLRSGGSTAGNAGIQLAYDIAKKNFIRDGNNRVILATDGDFNVGISDTKELVKVIEEKREQGIFLTALGFGMGNYKDDRLQQLADKGNGHHAYIDNILEAKKVFVNELTSTLFTIAKDVKLQAEFNPRHVKSYRLVGYENRLLNEEDFEDDTKDAGEIGAGHTVTVLYEIVPATDASKSRQLKYQQTILTDGEESQNDILTVRLRYKAPDGHESTEMASVVKNAPVELKAASASFRFSAAVAMYAMLLSGSEFKGTADWLEVQQLARSAKAEDEFGYRAEFIQLAERAEIIQQQQRASRE